MKRIGFTQRVALVPTYGERRDALDQRWMVVAEAFEALPLPIPNCGPRTRDYFDALGLDGVVLTGGNDIDAPDGAPDAAPERDATERALLAYAADKRLPVVGICRGFQMLQRFAGGLLVPVQLHAGTRHPVIWMDGFADDREVNSFHNWGVAPGGLAQDLRPLAHAPDGSVEAAAHRHLPWLGLMWHPEREPSLHGHDLALMRHSFSGEMF